MLINHSWSFRLYVVEKETQKRDRYVLVDAYKVVMRCTQKKSSSARSATYQALALSRESFKNKISNCNSRLSTIAI